MPNDSNVLIVNFLVGPGGGKSTLAHRVYTELKEKHPYNVYLVPDFAAMHAFAKNEQALLDHFSRTAETHAAIELAERSGHRIVLVENPLMMSLMYAQDTPYLNELRQLVQKVDSLRPALNFLLDRSPAYVYDEKSRHLNLEAAKKVDKKIRTYFSTYGIPAQDLPSLPTEERVQQVVGTIVARLEQDLLMDEARQASPVAPNRRVPRRAQ